MIVAARQIVAIKKSTKGPGGRGTLNYPLYSMGGVVVDSAAGTRNLESGWGGGGISQRDGTMPLGPLPEPPWVFITLLIRYGTPCCEGRGRQGGVLGRTSVSWLDPPTKAECQ